MKFFILFLFPVFLQAQILGQFIFIVHNIKFYEYEKPGFTL